MNTEEKREFEYTLTEKQTQAFDFLTSDQKAAVLFGG